MQRSAARKRAAIVWVLRERGEFLQGGTWRCTRAWNVQRRLSDFAYLQRMLARLNMAPATLPLQRTHPDEQTQNLSLFMEARCRQAMRVQLSFVHACAGLASSLAG